MITADQLIEIGRYNKAHGINGEISATFDCDTMAVGELMQHTARRVVIA